MDAHSLALLNQLIEHRVRRTQADVDSYHEGRGHSLAILIREFLSGIDSSRATFIAQMAAASDLERDVIGRQLLRLRQSLNELDSLLLPYASDIGRRDLPVGLLYLIDALIEALLPDPTDPVVHLSDDYMYSTQGLTAALRSVLPTLGASVPGGPASVLFNIPSSESTNALLAPILAHEIGHQAVNGRNLGSATLASADAAALNQLLTDRLAAAGITDASAWQLQFFRWLDELLCDALAAVMMGPSFLFASSAFLPAPAEGVIGTHPFPADRLRLTLAQLDAIGWTPIVQKHAPNVLAWAQDLAAPVGDLSDPLEGFLRGAIEIVAPAVTDVARSSVTGALEPEAFEQLKGGIGEMLQVGIPPAELSEEPVSPWAILLGAWLHQFVRYGDEPKTLGVAIADRDFNLFTMKAIEMSRVAELWKLS